MPCTKGLSSQDFLDEHRSAPPSLQTLPGTRLQTATQGSLARGCDASGLYLRTAHTPTRAHVESRGVPQSEPGDPKCKRPRSPLENSLPAIWAKGSSDKLTCSVWLGERTENRLCVPRGVLRSTRSFKYDLQIRRFVWIFRHSNSSPLQFDLTHTQGRQHGSSHSRRG